MKFLFLSDKQIGLIKHALGIAERSYSGLQEQYAQLERVRGNNIDKVDIRLHDKSCEFADVNLDIDKLLDRKKGSSNNQGITALRQFFYSLKMTLSGWHRSIAIQRKVRMRGRVKMKYMADTWRPLNMLPA